MKKICFNLNASSTEVMIALKRFVLTKLIVKGYLNLIYLLKLEANIGILLPKLFWPTVRKNCSSDWEKLLKFEAKGWEFAKFLRSLEQFIQTVKG